MGSRRSWNPTQELVDDIYRERVLRARRTPIEQKILAGAELFDFACQMTACRNSHQNPGADEATSAGNRFVERLDLLRRLRC